MVPEFPTPTINTLEVVVELSVVVVVDLLLLQEMMVKLKRKRERIMSKCFIKFPIGYFRKTQYITSIGLFYKKMGRLWMKSTSELMGAEFLILYVLIIN